MNSANFERKRMEAVLHRHGFRFQKKYGQNFLTDPAVLADIVEASGVTKNDFVLEIGPGMGTLTAQLAEAAGGVLAVEIDTKLIPILEEQLADRMNVELMQGDVMKLPLAEILEERAKGRPVRIVANLPYYITTPILMKLLEENIPYTSITVMVQKEVAERMTAGPGSKIYGALSLAVQYYTEPRIHFLLEPWAFFPPPKVESAVITLTRHETPPVSVRDEKLLFALIRASFNQRRKTLANALANGAGLSLSKEEIAQKIVEQGHPATVRGEALSLEEFARLADGLVNENCR